MSQYETLQKPFRVRMTPADCSLDIGDGSERGEYVNQDYLLRIFGRPHRGVNLMYCYYPYDKGWPQRASVAHKASGAFAWDYPYDDYFPYQGGSKGTTAGEPFGQIRDVRRHGQDPTLTLTMDCAVTDEEIAVVCRELAPFGRMRIRLNHECDGSWFSFNKRYSYAQVGEFFIRFSKVLKKTAPRIKLISCFGSVDPQTGDLKYAKELTPMLPYADVWSVDRYLSLHYGWPNNICEPEHLHKHYVVHGTEGMWREMEKVWEVFTKVSGERKPFDICEINADGDVGGPLEQRAECLRFYRKVLKERPSYLKGITYYQFRDRGRLGLEIEDPNNAACGIAQPFMKDYQELVFHPYFSSKSAWNPLTDSSELAMEWTASDDSAGLGWKVKLKKAPIFFEIKFPKELNLMVSVAGRWFYKKPGVEWVDAVDAVRSCGGKTIEISVFAPPADGANPVSGTGYADTVRTVLAGPPELRVRYGWKIPKK
jgi:hypothetical protein